LGYRIGASLINVISAILTVTLIIYLTLTLDFLIHGTTQKI